MEFIKNIQNFFCKELVTENGRLKQDNEELRKQLSTKQEQINAVNRYWKGVLYNQQNKKKPVKKAG